MAVFCHAPYSWKWHFWQDLDPWYLISSWRRHGPGAASARDPSRDHAATRATQNATAAIHFFMVALLPGATPLGERHEGRADRRPCYREIGRLQQVHRVSRVVDALAVVVLHEGEIVRRPVQREPL